jgi:hypothetical protein
MAVQQRSEQKRHCRESGGIPAAPNPTRQGCTSAYPGLRQDRSGAPGEQGCYGWSCAVGRLLRPLVHTLGPR